MIDFSYVTDKILSICCNDYALVLWMGILVDDHEMPHQHLWGHELNELVFFSLDQIWHKSHMKNFTEKKNYVTNLLMRMQN